MDQDILNIIIPIAALALYAINAYFQSQRKGEDEEEMPTEVREALEQERRAARTQEIQEEIRRRAARQQEARQGDAQPGSPTRSPTPVPSLPTAERTFTQTPEQASAPAADLQDALQRQMQALRDSEERRRRAIEQAQRRAGTVPSAPAAPAAPASAVGFWKRAPITADRLSVSDLRAELRDPFAARRAFIYSEVFGLPLGSREPGSNAPLSER